LIKHIQTEYIIPKFKTFNDLFIFLAKILYKELFGFPKQFVFLKSRYLTLLNPICVIEKLSTAMKDPTNIVTRIGNKSKYGKIFKIKSCGTFYVVKQLNNTKLNKIIWAEIEMSKMVTSLVKNKVCPNYLIYYGSSVNKVLNTTNLIYEFAFYGDMIDWLQDSFKDLPTMYNCILQILISIWCMFKKLNLTHYDLHLNNILVQRIDSTGYLKYNNILSSSSPIYIKNNSYMFLLCDFGIGRIPNKIELTEYKKFYSQYDNVPGDVVDYQKFFGNLSKHKKSFDKSLHDYLLLSIKKQLPLLTIIEQVYNSYSTVLPLPERIPNQNCLEFDFNAQGIPIEF
jgi:hypothetical protein